MILTVGQLKQELFHFPNDWEVHIELDGQYAKAQGVSTETKDGLTWVLISNYPDTE